MNLSPEFKVKSGLLSRDFDLVPWDADVLRVLFATAVVHAETRTLSDYYGGIFDAAAGKMRTIEPVATREEYIATAVGMLNGEYAALRDPSRFAWVDADSADDVVRSTLNEALARFSFLGATLPEEAETVRYDLCRLQGGDVGALHEGMVFVRRSSAVAVVVQPVQDLWFDGTRVTRYAQPKGDVQTRAEVICEEYRHTVQAQLLQSMEMICNALAYLPTVGPIFEVLGSTMDLFSALTGNQPSFGDMLTAVQRITQTELARDAMRENLANIETWSLQLRTLQAGLLGHMNPPPHLLDDYRDALKDQAYGTALGTVPNSVVQLWSLLRERAAEEMDFREDLLKALVLGLGYALMIRRDLVLIYAQYAKYYKDNGNQAEYKKYHDLAKKAYDEYESVIRSDPFNPDGLKTRIGEWEWQRGYPNTLYSHPWCGYEFAPDNPYPYNVASACKPGYLCYTLYVADKGRRDGQGRLPGEPVYCDWNSHDAGVAWLRGRVVDYQSSVNAEVTANLHPLLQRCDQMVQAFENLTLEPQGLTGQYFANRDLSGAPVLTRVDPTVNFDWGGTAPDARLPSDNFSVRWSGQVQAVVSGAHTFTTTSDDGVRLWVNGKVLVDNWTTHGATDDSGTIELRAGELYSIKMEYFEASGGAVARLWWAYPGASRTIIVSGRLFPSSPTGG